ncbi:unnamed protein product [Acanthoscelides obtectus]|uniref:Uncharacterized protein n=1 Tax=Acanthoscelides obtectus TaxID=200917 RepID=A0A9P0Q1U4_ACAOB|nr:unnamed protein product [Acanthoscelides obtectus]CAK1679544.1 hypothetical protein AOBTE_LOCUS32342 [Acanthoscelides obtectus]
MSIAMHFSQVLTVFWLVVAASQYGKAIDVDLAKGLAGTAAAAGLAGTAAAAGLAGTAAAAGLAKAGLATAALADAGAAGIAGAAGAGGLAGAALEAKKALLVKAALIKLIKAKLAANGLIGSEVVYSSKYAPVNTVQTVAVPQVQTVQEVPIAVSYGKGDALVKAKGLIALLASLALAKEGIKKINAVKHTEIIQPVATVAQPIYASAPIAGVAIEQGKYITNKEAVVADKTWSIAGEKILKGLLIKLGLVSAGVAADAFIKKLAFVKDAELLPLLLTAGLLDERGWIPDAYVKDGVSFWGQLLPNFSEASIVKLLGNIVY